MTAHGTISEQIYLHAATHPLEDHRDLGLVMFLTDDGDDPASFSPTFDGVASDGRQCRAITARDARCPKDSAVSLFVDGGHVAVCGGHYGVHRRGKPLWLVVEP